MEGNSTIAQNSFFYILLLYLVFIFSKMKHFLLDISFDKDTL